MSHVFAAAQLADDAADPQVEGSAEHEQVTFCQDRESGLRAIIAIHSTALGPRSAGPASTPIGVKTRHWRTC